MVQLRAQFEGIYLEHHGLVGRCLARWGVSPAGIDDARQDVFLIAFRRLHTYGGQGSMRAWLVGISRRVAWRHRRTRQRHDRRVDALARAPKEDASLDEWVRMREARAVLDAFIETLDPPKREAFVLCELEGLSAREAASATGVNQATLYSRLKVARSSFASMCATLEQQDIPERAAAIHRETYPDEPRAAARGWAMLVPKLATTSWLAKPLLLAGIGLGTVGAVSVAALRPSSPEPARVAALVSTPRVPAVPSEPRSRPHREPAPPTAEEAPPEPRPRRPAKRTEPEPDELPAMAEQLAQAERHLDQKAFADAARVAEAHLARWPKGPLARDALQVAVRARCEAGQRTVAEDLARRHLGDRAATWLQTRCKETDGGIMKPTRAGD